MDIAREYFLIRCSTARFYGTIFGMLCFDRGFNQIPPMLYANQHKRASRQVRTRRVVYEKKNNGGNIYLSNFNFRTLTKTTIEKIDAFQ